jgi:energy-coupling factor transport system substrate-specific component
VLALALAAGFAWYERSRPDARIVALVATLAAFAALGRIAFAALPNVKPTTDIVLVSGYALAGAPGFVVGAVAGLTSNFFFGQGPWTPWQMAAWGMTGVIGAGLALVTRGRISRWPLALVCAATGYAFAAVQDVGDWVNYSDHSTAQLGIYVAKGTGFDFVHAGGCLLFALAFGPALIRSIQRFAARLEVSWPPAELPRSSLLVGLLALLTGASIATTVAPAARAGGSPTGYLLAAQNSDGGFGGAAGTPSSGLFSGWAALGLAAAGHGPATVARGGTSLLSYVRAQAGGSLDVGSLERTTLVASAAGAAARQFGGVDLVAQLERQFRADGSVSDQVNLTSFAVLALRSAGIAPPPATVPWLAAQQNGDGGFSFARAGGGSDVDDTGAALEALGSGSAATGRATNFIRREQGSDGGFPSEPGGDSNAQSTAWAIQGLIAAGVDPGALHRGGARSPLAYLRSLIAGDGHVRYSAGADQTPVWVTAQALIALERKPLPLASIGTRGVAAASAASAGALRARTARASGARRRAVAGRRARAQASTAAMQRYATDAGLLMALALTPVGAS